jgi:hypothetical protein
MTNNMIIETTSITALKGFSVFAVKSLLPPLVPVLAVAENVITESTGVPLTILAAVGGACWYLQGRFTKIEDKLEQLSEDLAKLPCHRDYCMHSNKEKET